jgi:type IV secretion system protein VirB2
MKFIKTPFVYLATLVAFFLSAPVFADGFSKAETLLEKISSGLSGLAVVTITIAVIWVGYKVLWDGKSLHDCKGIIIGGILIASAAEIGSMLMN